MNTPSQKQGCLNSYSPWRSDLVDCLTHHLKHHYNGERERDSSALYGPEHIHAVGPAKWSEFHISNAKTQKIIHPLLSWSFKYQI